MRVIQSIFDRHVDLLHKSLDMRSRRNNLLSGNIANVETPGYKSKDLVFEQALGKAMKADIPGPLRITDSRHMDGRGLVPLEQVQPEVILTSNPVGNLDDNSVDLEREMAKLAENQLNYQGLTQMIGHKFAQLRASIREGGV
ncbi:MAG: flagellar basal body rod protein FlgB [Deltaproteobacteria bacterium]|nr:flagellar basal body rod protein FlgB [Deltaproteobacteria bacterium]